MIVYIYSYIFKHPVNFMALKTTNFTMYNAYVFYKNLYYEYVSYVLETLQRCIPLVTLVHCNCRASTFIRVVETVKG